MGRGRGRLRVMLEVEYEGCEEGVGYRDGLRMVVFRAGRRVDRKDENGWENSTEI